MELRSKYFVLKFSVVLISIIILAPIFFLVYKFLSTDLDLGFFLNNNLFKYFTKTMQLALYTCLFALLFGVFPAFFVTFFNLKYKKLFDVLLVLPLAIPCYVMAYTYSDLFGYGGFFSYLFNGTIDDSMIWFEVMRIEFLSLFLALALYPYIYTTSRISFSLIGSTFINLSKSLNLSNWHIFLKVILPLSFSGVFSGVLLIVMEVFNEYGAVRYFNIKTFSYGIFKEYYAGDNISYLLLLSVVLLSLVLLFIFISNLIKKRNTQIMYHLKSTNKTILFNKSNYFIYSLVLMPFILGFVIPVFNMMNNVLKMESVALSDAMQPMFNTITLGLITSMITVFISFYILRVQRLSKNNVVNFMVKLLSSGYAIPGAIIALSLFIGLKDTFFSIVLTATIFGLIYAYLFRFMAVAILPIQSSLSREPGIYENQAKSLNMNFFNIFKKITLPLNKYAIISAFILVFIDVVKELPLTLILRPPNFDTLALLTYEKLIFEESVIASSYFSLILVFICSILLIGVILISDRKYVFKN